PNELGAALFFRSLLGGDVCKEGGVMILGLTGLMIKKSGLYQSSRFEQNFILPLNKIGCQY
ncbi:hypothetical protein R0J90_20365, partial [Micrococcus sp. SIMBA_144]